MRNIGYTLIHTYAESIFSAIHNDLGQVVYQYRKPGDKPGTEVEKTRDVELGDVWRVESWQQTYSSSTGPFGGVGTSAMMEFNMVAVATRTEVACYANGRLMYVIAGPNEAFWEDVASRRLKDGPESYLKQ